MARKHGKQQRAIAASYINNPFVVAERIMRDQRTVHALRHALHGLVKQPSGVWPRGETCPQISPKNIAESMFPGANGMGQCLPGFALVVTEKQKRPRPH